MSGRLILFILCVIPALNFYYYGNLRGFTLTNTERNLGLISIWAFISICFHVVLQLIQLDAQGSNYWNLYQLSCGLLLILSSGVYYIFRLPFTNTFTPGPGWAPNRSVGAPAYVDPESKVDSAPDREKRKLHWEIHQTLEQQEREFFKVVQQRENQGRDNSVSTPLDIQRSGYHVYDFLEYVKYRRPRPSVDPGAREPQPTLTDPSNIHEVLWWVDGGGLQCHNSFNPHPHRGGLPSPGNESVIFTNYVSVDRPDQVGPAINLIKQTLRNIPYYTTTEPSRNQFKYSVGIDVELLDFPPEFYRPADMQGLRGLGTKSFRQPNGYEIREDGTCVLDGSEPQRSGDYLPLEEDIDLVSCMSIAVDKALVVNFHVFYMIRNIETAEQLEQLSGIFDQIIFNPRIIKVWYNPQQSIIALNATIEEIYRGTERAKFREVITASGGGAIEYSPKYKLRLQTGQKKIFSTTRPERFTFGPDERWGRRCPYEFHTNAVNNYQQPCPCRSNNLDIAVIVEFIMRDIGLRPANVGGTSFNQRAWTETRQRCGFNDFERCLLRGNRSADLLNIIKRDIPSKFAQRVPNYNSNECTEDCLREKEPGETCARACPNFGRWSEVLQDTRSRMYRAFAHPSFQEDYRLLGYMTGDILGITMILRFLMTTENPRLLLERLRLWSSKPIVGRLDTDFLRPPTGPIAHQYVNCRWHSSSKLIRHIRLFIDNPAFKREDMISWLDDRALRSSVHRTTKYRFLEPEEMLCYFLGELWRRQPKILGEYIVQQIASKPFRPRRPPANSAPTRWDSEIEAGYSQSHRQFTLDEILGFFEAPDWTTMSSQIVQMVIGYFELKLIHEYQNDIIRVQTMRNQMEESQHRLRNLTAGDIEAIGLARGVLRTTQIPNGPNWFTTTRELLFRASKDTSVTGGGLFLKPGEELEYWDHWANRTSEIRSLLESLLALQQLNAHRIQEFDRLLDPISVPENKQTLVSATSSNVTPFHMPVLESLLGGTTRAPNIGNYDLTTTDPILLYWAILVLRYDRPLTRLRPKTFAQRIFDITYSPTNFYIPLLQSVVKTATEPSRYERTQPMHHYLNVRAANRVMQRLKDEKEGEVTPPRPPQRRGTVELHIPPMEVEMGWGVDPPINMETDEDLSTDDPIDTDDPGGVVGLDVPSWGAHDQNPNDDPSQEPVDNPVDNPEGPLKSPYTNIWDPTTAVPTQGIFTLLFNVEADGIPWAEMPALEVGTDDRNRNQMSVEKAQFLRMLQATMNIWCRS